MQRIHRLALAAASTALVATAVPAHDNDRPFVPSSVKVTAYDGVTDDLLSAGLNLAGLVSATAPPIADPLNPTPAELRKRAIYGNFRGIVDPATAGGMGLLWGPGSQGAPTFPAPVVPGLIPGVEYKAYLTVPDWHGHVNNVPAAVQIPRHFNRHKPCIVAAVPSGSRSLYGGIAIAEWALFKGCAVALPGKGTDTGFHLLGAEAAAYAVNDLDGVFGPADAIGHDAQFAVRDSRRLDRYLADNPHRIATKHAHSQINPERLWGQFALKGIEFAFWALNDHFEKKGGKRFDRRNTIVIAAGASNGGGMALRALEDDEKGLIDGLVVTEPNIGPQDGHFVIRFGNDPPFDPAGRSIYDSITLMSVYAPCAALSPTLAGTPFFGLPPLGGAPPNAPQNRCAALKAKGLVSGDDIVTQANSALARIREHGYAVAQDWGIASHEWLSLWRSLQITYANAYGRFAVQDNVCGVSFAAVGPSLAPAPIAEAVAKRLFADSSGVPATGGVSIIADRSQGGPILENFAISPATGTGDLNFDSALCFRSLQTGDGLGDARAWFEHARVRAGTREIQTTGRLHGKPAIVIHGRRDALVFPNLQSRAYYGLNQQREGKKSRLSYIEVTTGQHFDAFISSLFLGATGAQFVPLHYYYLRAMDSMYDHLTKGAALPPSQVVRPTPRGTAAYTDANVPALFPPAVLVPAAGNRIVFKDRVLSIPE